MKAQQKPSNQIGTQTKVKPNCNIRDNAAHTGRDGLTAAMIAVTAAVITAAELIQEDTAITVNIAERRLVVIVVRDLSGGIITVTVAVMSATFAFIIKRCEKRSPHVSKG